MRPFLLLALVATLPAYGQSDSAPRDCGPLPTKFEGMAYPVDGATLGGVGFAPLIRLWGVQAPALHDRDGMEMLIGMTARAMLMEKVAGVGPVRCEIAKWDHDCRVVARCTILDGQTRRQAEASDKLLEEARRKYGVPAPPPGKEPVATAPDKEGHDLAPMLLMEGTVYAHALHDTFPGRPELSADYARSENFAREQRQGLWPLWLGVRARQALPPR